MARSFSYRNMIVHFQSPSQKTSANPVTGHGIIKLLTPIHFARIGVRSSYNESRRENGIGFLASYNESRRENGVDSSRKNYKPSKRSSSGRFHYPSENYIRELLKKPLHFTRIGVRSLYNESRRENGIGVRSSYNESRRENGVDSPWKKEKDYKPVKRSSSGPLIYPSEDYIRELLDNSRRPLSESAATELREDIQGIPVKERHILFDMLKPKYISRMWEIAGYNHIDCAADMLPSMESKPESKPLLLECWRGKIDKRFFVFWDAKNKFEMAFFRGTDGHLYGHLDSKIFRGTFDRLKKGSLYFIIKNPSCLAFESGKGKQQLRELPQTVPKPGKTIMRNANKVSPLDIEDIDAKNPNETSTNVENYNLVFKFVDGKREIHGLPQNSENFPKPVKHPEQFSDLLVYIRSAGPNVLVGQAWRKGREHLGEIVLIKKIE